MKSELILESKIEAVKNFQGALVLSAIVSGIRVHRVYIGYSKAYCMRHFKNNLPY